MTTARALLKRLLSRGRINPAEVGTADPGAGGAEQEKRSADERLDAARERLKRTIPPPEGEGGSSSVSNDPPPDVS